jgi:hypothetical protein
VIKVNGSGTRSDLRDLQAAIHGALHQALRSAVDAATESAKSTTLFNDQTGATRGSIHGEVEGDAGFVEAGGAAGFLENGTPPHRIEGNPVLAFEMNGSVVFARYVDDHPGTAERPFMSEAQRVGEQTAAYAVDFFVGYAIDKSNRSS